MTQEERITALEARLASAEARIALMETVSVPFVTVSDPYDPCSMCGPTCDSVACPKRMQITYTTDSITGPGLPPGLDPTSVPV